MRPCSGRCVAAARAPKGGQSTVSGDDAVYLEATSDSSERGSPLVSWSRPTRNRCNKRRRLMWNSRLPV